MTYSRAQLRKRYMKGVFIGILIGASLMFVGTTFSGVFADLGGRYGDLIKERGEETAEEKAEELREQVAQGGGELRPEDLAALKEQEKEAAEEAAEPEASKEEEPTPEEEPEPEPDPEPSPATANVYQDATARYQVTLPEGWTSKKSFGEVKLNDNSAKATSGMLLRTRSKTAGTTLEDVYDGSRAPAYYLDATAGATETTVNGHPAVRFDGVVGFAPTTITAIDLGNRVVELHDPGEEYQASGTYAAVLGSFQEL